MGLDWCALSSSASDRQSVSQPGSKKQWRVQYTQNAQPHAQHMRSVLKNAQATQWMAATLCATDGKGWQIKGRTAVQSGWQPITRPCPRHKNTRCSEEVGTARQSSSAAGASDLEGRTLRRAPAAAGRKASTIIGFCFAAPRGVPGASSTVYESEKPGSAGPSRAGPSSGRQPPHGRRGCCGSSRRRSLAPATNA